MLQGVASATKTFGNLGKSTDMEFPQNTADANILDRLTDAQRQAVQHTEGPLLILAGPGSGKTRVITHRIAYLLQQGVGSHEILGLTFTNKAADEMQQRLEMLVPRQRVWLGTFHRFCSRLLRQHAGLIGLQENFSIFDTQDSKQVLKQAIADADVALEMTTPQSIAAAISWAKNELVSPEDYTPRSGSDVGGLTERVYPAYQKRLMSANAVDFDDLLYHAATLLRDNPELRETLDARFRFIMVDEYQDTNTAQYAIVRALSVDQPNLAVTGDPDQSIYGWRGANLNNILDFEKDYQQVHVVRLERNYRSTPNILRLADQLIENNVRRKKKKLYTTRDEGDPVRMVVFPTGRDEADGIATRIMAEVQEGRRKYRDFAIFYRTNALSRVLENALRAQYIPYQIVHGLEFFQRKEIKDILAYLHLLNNPHNDVAFLRIVNTPPRKIGKKTIDRLTAHARRYELSLLEAAREAGLIEPLTKQAAVAIAKFVAMIDRVAVTITQPLENLMQSVLQETGYRDWLQRSDSEEDQERLANIEELVTAAREFDLTHPGDTGGLDEFLEQTALVSDIDEWEEQVDKVTLMTLHASKGLEFPSVFIVAVEEGLIPHERSMHASDDIEEERRLLFVGVTRAEEDLQLSLAQYRDFRGRRSPTVPSSFLVELPREEMTYSEPNYYAADPAEDLHAADPWDDVSDEQVNSLTDLQEHEAFTTGSELETARDGTPRVPPHLFRQGMIVDHPDYGSGTIIAVSGTGKKRSATVNFFSDGIERSYYLAYSPLTPSEFNDM